MFVVESVVFVVGCVVLGVVDDGRRVVVVVSVEVGCIRVVLLRVDGVAVVIGGGGFVDVVEVVVVVVDVVIVAVVVVVVIVVAFVVGVVVVVRVGIFGKGAFNKVPEILINFSLFQKRQHIISPTILTLLTC